VTFKDLRKIIAEKKKEIERESKFYNTNYYWKGKKVVSMNQWGEDQKQLRSKRSITIFPK